MSLTICFLELSEKKSQGPKRVRITHDKRAIGVRVIGSLLDYTRRNEHSTGIAHHAFTLDYICKFNLKQLRMTPFYEVSIFVVCAVGYQIDIKDILVN